MNWFALCVAILSFSVSSFATQPSVNRTKCEGLLNKPFSPIKEGYEQISFYAKGTDETRDVRVALKLNRNLLKKMSEVLENSGLADKVLFVYAEALSQVNLDALELLDKGVDLRTVDEFYPNWLYSEPKRTIFWDLRDPLYLLLKCQIREDLQWFDLWVESTAKDEVIRILKEKISTGVFFDRRNDGDGIKPWS